jgi:hypothetical protein
MSLQILAIVVLGLMCGSELNVAAFGHPILSSQPLAVHMPVRAALARLLGRVMPFWMGGSALLNLLLLLPFERLSGTAWRLVAIASAIQVAAVAFSVVSLVPINNRVAKWTPDTVPADWKEQVRRWDSYHWFRTAGLVVAFAILIWSAMVG